MTISRRRFLKTSLGAGTVLSFSARAPEFLVRAAERSSPERILVVVQMSGGNDGLNTVVPFADDAYRKSRPSLAIAENQVLKIDDRFGFHPSLRGFADLLEASRLAVIQGVGYPNPNRSHFESMDIWHTCLRKTEVRQDGWIGRYLESQDRSSKVDVRAMHLGKEEQPFALASRDVRVPTVRSLSEFRLQDGDNRSFRKTVQSLAETNRQGADALLEFVQSSTTSALIASERITASGSNYEPTRAYPESDLAEKLQTVAQLIDAGLGTSVYYVAIDGFDTHARQAAAHTGLLNRVGGAVSTFIDDLAAHGHSDRVLLMCFSEFGRRVAENASAGTDHGTAAPLFLAGDKVQAGLIGKHPSLTSLESGDLKYRVDFRQVYATVLQRWLQTDSQSIIQGEYAPIDALEV
jgi:uncharacterized protein (DUF1501 family)